MGHALISDLDSVFYNRDDSASSSDVVRGAICVGSQVIRRDLDRQVELRSAAPTTIHSGEIGVGSQVSHIVSE